MPTQTTLANQRELQIKASDKRDQSYLSALMQDTSATVASQLKYFRDKYSQDGILTVSDMRRAVNADDYVMWRKILKKYESRLQKDEQGSYRLKQSKKMAGIDRANLLSSIVRIAVAYTIVGVNDYVQHTIKNESNDTMNFQHKLLQLTHKNIKSVTAQVEAKTDQVIEQETQGLTNEDRIWLRADKLASEVNRAIDRGVNVGLDDDYYNQHLYNDGSAGNQNSVPALFGSAGNYYANTLLRDQKATVETIVSNYIALQNRLKHCNWHTVEDNRVCKLCEELSASGPYAINAVPPKPHNGCRCFFVYY